MTTQEQYYELSFYTLTLRDKNFIHQHIVDAYNAQTADANTKPIAIFFALAGLYLLVKKNYTGKQVQDAHVQMAKKTKEFIKIILPENRGDITVKDALEKQPGVERDEMIYKWCNSVWEAFSNEHDKIISLTEKLLKK